MVLPERRLAMTADDRAGDADRRRRAGDVDVAPADREHLTDPGGRAEHDLDDRAELPIGPGA